MSYQPLDTKYAPAERVHPEILKIQTKTILDKQELSIFLDAVPEVYMILNQMRQIVYVNNAIKGLLGIDDYSHLIGQRPGEVLNCSASFEHEGGCGTAEACRTCGAVNAILSSLNGTEDVQECRILQKDSGDSLDLKVWATPYKFEGHNYSIFAITDISNEKRRRALERIFFHDVLNTAGGVKGFADLLIPEPSEESESYKQIIINLSSKLIDEIQAQKQLAAAEVNELGLHITKINSLKILVDSENLYKNHEITGKRLIKISDDTSYVDFFSDLTLISRVVGNMTKNALEASNSEQIVSIGCHTEDNSIVFWVNNPNFIPRDIQLQIFKRSYSTKGTGRGLGTYSMKLITERYLNGKVWFESNEESGTTFYAKYPIVLEDETSS